MVDYIKETITESIAVKQALLKDDETIAIIREVAEAIYQAFINGGKVLLCGNGGSAADAQHIAAEFVGRFVYERRALHAVALTTDSSIFTAVGNDYGFEYIFERQVEALGQANDIFIGISTSGNSRNVERALLRAKAKGMVTVGLLGGTGGSCMALCDYPIVVKSSVAARIQESHIMIGHALCAVVDAKVYQDEQ